MPNITDARVFLIMMGARKVGNALYAWGEFEPGVSTGRIEIPGDGLYVLGSKVIDLGGGIDQIRTVETAAGNRKTTNRQRVPGGQLLFQFVDGYSIHVWVYRTRDFEGEPTETREAQPLWTPVDDIPFEDYLRRYHAQSL